MYTLSITHIIGILMKIQCIPTDLVPYPKLYDGNAVEWLHDLLELPYIVWCIYCILLRVLS